MDRSRRGTTEPCLPLALPKQRAVLAFLLLHANQVVATDRLIDQLWGDEAPETVKVILQGYISSLRKALGAGMIVTRAPGYAIQVEAELARPASLRKPSLAGASRGRRLPTPAGAAAGFREALELWRGPALVDFAYEPFAQAPILRLEELRLTALEDRIEADLALGRHAPLVAELEALVAEHPLRERLRGQLMLALYRSARQAEALGAYQQARRVLVDELGIEPTQALQDLERSILRQDPALDLPSKAPGSAPAEAPPPERAILAVAQEAASLGRRADACRAAGQAARLARSSWRFSSRTWPSCRRATATLGERREALVRSGLRRARRRSRPSSGAPTPPGLRASRASTCCSWGTGRARVGRGARPRSGRRSHRRAV